MKKINGLDERLIIYFIVNIIDVILLLLVAIFFQIKNDIFIYFTIILAIIFVLNNIYFYKHIYKPGLLIKREINSFNLGGDINALVTLDKYYFKEMKDAIFKMTDLINNQRAIESTNKQAAYLALQNQINPHFLYNTLEAIRGDALEIEAENIANITEALAIFFRYTISNIDSLVTLNEELMNVENYFAIQQYRFMEKIKLVINYKDYNQSNLYYHIPKLTIQPLIENAIVHGLEPKVGSGIITISIKKTKERLLINISDDGVGIDEKQLLTISKKLTGITGLENENSKGGIALINVNNRIKLLFGEKYGLKVNSIVNYGTSIDILLPLVLKKS